jgi:predicted GH43/DUF377 family glycosyl hydrolase
MISSDVPREYAATFNRLDRVYGGQAVSDQEAADWMAENVPHFECPDRDIEAIYYFRWWTYRKHIKSTPDGFVITEFRPDVPWAGKHNTISCPAGHHLYEGRWLRDSKILDDYATFWLRGGGEPRRYSSWLGDALLARCRVSGDTDFTVDLLFDLVENHRAWEASHMDACGLFWQIDDRDGMEVSIAGSRHPQQQGYRATINSYMYGDAMAIAAIAELAGRADIAGIYNEKADHIRERVLGRLWDEAAAFFKVIPRGATEPVDVRELHGFTPWYFELPPAKQEYEEAWRQLMDSDGFLAPYGPTTAEQRHPEFAVSCDGHCCQWNGPSWPFATSVTLTALANVLNDYPQDIVSKRDYFDMLKRYTKSHHITRENGAIEPWIDENLDPFTGAWVARQRVADREPAARGEDYNHSTYCDLIISGLVGLRPRSDDTIEVNPLLPEGAWDWFCLDGVNYHGHTLTIVWDKTGDKYGAGQGLRILVDGEEVAVAERLERLTASLPSSTEAKPVPHSSQSDGGWKKHPANPVLGGERYGTIFDVSVLRANGEYWMYCSWRPEKSIALSRSPDGVVWSEPQIVLGPVATGWEDDINRPGVLYRDGVYHMWYTGQAEKVSKIGYATSTDGVTFERRAEPVLVADSDWEQPSVMCPHVLWDEDQKLFRMWYSGGDNYEPDAIGYATSADGISWQKHTGNPVFAADAATDWEKAKVTACQVFWHDGWFIMFYIGFENTHLARIGVARSRDGISGWERHPGNPIISPTEDGWDAKSCYKPFAVYEEEHGRWLLWYNGRCDGEMIGLAIHEGEDLGFEESGGGR